MKGVRKTCTAPGGEKKRTKLRSGTQRATSAGSSTGEGSATTSAASVGSAASAGVFAAPWTRGSYGKLSVDAQSYVFSFSATILALSMSSA